MNVLGLRLIVLSFVCLITGVAHAADQSTKCEASRLKLAGKYSTCLLKAEAKALLRAAPVDTTACIEKFDEKCARILAKYGLDCTPPRDCDLLGAAAQCTFDALPLPTTTTTTTTTTLPPACVPGLDTDADGFTVIEGDCDDCDPLVNPGAYDFVGNGLNDDCTGVTDDPAAACDSGLSLIDADALNGARAIDLCQQTTVMARDWGVLSSSYVRADGTAFVPAQTTGIMSAFGSNVSPQVGSSMLVLSSGRARSATQPGACSSASCNSSGLGTAPSGFPQDVPGCPVSTTINDDVALQVQLRVPTNAAGYRFRFDFYSFEYPEWVCTNYNDQFVALASPAPPGAINGNISFEAASTPISVNATLKVCSGCPNGTAELAGTGFDTWNDAGATDWLVTQAPVTPGDILTLRFAIWDSGDQAFDSTVLLDGFEWIAEGPVSVQTTTAP